MAAGWKDEAYKAYVAKWEAEQAQESERRRREGKFAIWLQRAEGDAETFTRDQQTELNSVVTALRDEGVELEAPFMTLDAADAVGGYIGQLVIPVAQIAVPAISGALLGWIKGRSGRKILIEFYPDGKPKKIEAQTEEQVISMLDAARKSGTAKEED